MRYNDVYEIDYEAYRVTDNDPRITQGEEDIDSRVEEIDERIAQLQHEMSLLTKEKASLASDKRNLRRHWQKKELKAFEEDLIEELNLRDRFPQVQLKKLLVHAGFPDESGEYMSYDPEALHDKLESVLAILP